MSSEPRGSTRTDLDTVQKGQNDSSEQVLKQNDGLDGPDTREHIPDNVTLILVAGFMAFNWSLIPLQRYFIWKGWKDVIIFKYDTRGGSIEGHGAALAKFVSKLSQKKPNQQFYFYATSMGNLVVRAALSNPEMPEVAKTGKHVLVGPAWRGATWGRFANKIFFARWISGNGCGKQLREAPMDGFDYLGHHPENMTNLVLTAISNLNPFIPKPNDGTILEEETLLNTPHYRYCIGWGWHAILNFTPAIWRLSHEFFVGKLDKFVAHPGIAAQKASSSQAKHG